MKHWLFVPVLLILGLISYLFWGFTIKDYLPTALPRNYRSVQIGDQIDVEGLEMKQKPVFLHFFSPDCPCSRFNLDHVRRLISKYGKEIDFIMVLQVENEMADYDWKNLEE